MEKKIERETEREIEREIYRQRYTPTHKYTRMHTQETQTYKQEIRTKTVPSFSSNGEKKLERDVKY